ncbi:MAG: glycosyltransferase family 2 protein [Luteimonas sp.]
MDDAAYNGSNPRTHHVVPLHPPLPVSGVVVAFNERDRIERCLDSLLAVCAEVILVDSGSTDGTVELARAKSVEVVHQDWLGYAAQKNLAISRATRRWVLLLDADEWLEPEACRSLVALFQNERNECADVWQLQRRTHFLGKAMRFGSFSREPVERLFRAHLRHVVQPVHEYLDTKGQRVALSSIRLEHDTARSPAEYRQKLGRYAVLWADAAALRGKTGGAIRGVTSALAYAMKNLLIRGGLLDGPRAWRFHWIHMRYSMQKYSLLGTASRTGRQQG